MQYLYIFVGGALGALIRFCLSMLNEGSTIPLGTFVANLLGAFLMGSIGALSLSLFKTHPNIKKRAYYWFTWCVNYLFNISI